MHGSRRNTVYDLTSLRLHPDGSRVHQTKKNLELGKYRQNIHDPRRQWIAADAAGTHTVPVKYRSIQKSEPEDETLHIEKREEEGKDSSEESTHKGKKTRRKNLRSTKRKSFREDDSYLGGYAQDAPVPDEESLQMPSQDLLKNIHYLASKYYDENNQLINAPRRYHKERKRRRLLKQGLASEGNGDEDGEEATGSDSSETLEIKLRWVGSKTHRDMYRVLDGSVLVAMGMFTQEFIKKLVRHGQSRQSNANSHMENADSEIEADDSEDQQEEHVDVNGEAEEKNDNEVGNLDG